MHYRNSFLKQIAISQKLLPKKIALLVNQSTATKLVHF